MKATQSFKSGKAAQISTGTLHVFYSDIAPACDQFSVIKETEKAIQIQCDDVEEKHRYPVWVPKSAIKEQWTKGLKNEPACLLHWAGWFHRKMSGEKAWKRVALRLSSY